MNTILEEYKSSRERIVNKVSLEFKEAVDNKSTKSSKNVLLTF